MRSMAFCHKLRLGHFATDFRIGILPMLFSSPFTLRRADRYERFSSPASEVCFD